MNIKFLSTAFTVISLAFILLVQGAIPFLSIPTLGQSIWTMGFAQSFANQSIFDIYAINFGAPKPVAIAFGLAGAYPASLFIRVGVHPADAYTLMAAVWFTVAFLGSMQLARSFNISMPLSALAAVLWLTMPIVWVHADYSMVSMGIGLLPFYFWTSLRLFQCLEGRGFMSLTTAGLYLQATIIAVFMDGYTFMMFAVGSSIFGAYTYLRDHKNRVTILKFCFPIHVFSFALSYVLYASFIGKLQFEPSPLEFFRGWGFDLMFLAIPTEGIHGLWDTIGVSLPRTANEQFGDASVWTTTFAIPIVFIGSLAWWRTRKESRLATGFLLIALFGFYMGMGPSLKLNSIKPEGISTSSMASEYAIAPTGNAWLSEKIPGFNSMRAAYRWSALGFLGFWLLIVLFISHQKSARAKWLVFFILVSLIASNLPNVKEKLAKNIEQKSDFLEIDRSFVETLKRDLRQGEMVAFLPYRNDFLANYLASRTNIFTYNIGGDKNLVEAKKHWPATLKQFKMGEIDKDFAHNVLHLLVKGDADAIILPYIDLLWGAHVWPYPPKFKYEIQHVTEELIASNITKVEERELYTIVRLEKNVRSNIPSLLNYDVYCAPPICLQYDGNNRIPSQVGIHTGKGIQTNAQAGYLIFGPYKPMLPGKYTLQVTGNVKTIGDNVIIDVVSHHGNKTYARFRSLGTKKHIDKNIILKETVILENGAADLEVRVLVGKDVDLLIDGYSLSPATEHNN